MRILIVRYGTVGDSVLTSAFIRELRNFYKDAQIDVLADVISRSIFEYCPYIDNFIEIKDKHKSFFIKYPQLLKIANQLKGYDKIYYTRPDEHFISIAAKLAGIPERVGYIGQRNKFVTKGCEYDEHIHVVDSIMGILKADGIPVENTNLEVWLNEVCDAEIKLLLRELNPSNKKVILIHAATRVWQKNWLNEYWISVIKHILSRNDSIVVLAGALKDLAIYKKILKGFSPTERSNIINSAGCFSIQQSIALVKYADLLVGLDSGLMHVAAAFNKPSIMLHGSSPLVQYRPKNDKCKVVSLNYPCSPCIMNLSSKGIGCKNEIPKCFKNLTPDLVIGEIDKIMNDLCEEEKK